ncbi:PhoH family protein [Achromobacter sp. AGC39]
MGKHQFSRKPEPKTFRKASGGRPQYEHEQDFGYDRPIPPIRASAEPLVAQTEKQRDYMRAIEHYDVVFGMGPAGTGKTYVAGAKAVELLLRDSNPFEKIIITRPAVDAGESFGFLPGEIEDKYEPYIAAFRDVLNERLGKGCVDYYLKAGKIEGMPFAFMRGRTFKNCIVVLDEAQNATPEQMKLFLTRVGQNCKVIINGDESQKDIHNSGFADAAARVGHIPCVKVVRFNRNEIIRSGFVSEVVQAYEMPASAPSLH